MKNLSIVIMLAFVTGATTAQDLKKAFKFQSSEDERGMRITTDNTGDVIATGYFAATADFDPAISATMALSPTGLNEHDVYVAKYDADLNFKWAVKFGNSSFDYSYALATDESNNIIVGGDYVLSSGTNGRDGFVNKYDPNGVLLFTIPIGGSSKDVVYGVKTDALNNIYVTGYFGGTVDFDPSSATYTMSTNGGRDIFLAKYDATGKFLWAHHTGGTMSTAYEEGGQDLVIAGQYIYLTGQFEGKVDFDFKSAVNTMTSNGSLDIFVAKYDTAANYQWSFNMGAASKHDYAYGIDVDASENLYITGGFEETVDFDPSATTATLVSGSVAAHDIYIAKYSSSGAYQWAFNVGGKSAVDDEGYDIDVSGNDIFVGGSFWGPCDFDPSLGVHSSYTGNNQAFMARYTTSGNFVWAFEIGGTSGTGPADNVFGIHHAANGRLYVTGDFYGAADFAPGPVTVSLDGNNRGHGFIASYGAEIYTGLTPATSNENNIRLFPNPASHNLTVVLDYFEEGQWDLIIHDVTGKQILVNNNINDNNVTVDVEALSRGLYFYTVKTPAHTFTNKLIIE